MDTQTAPNQQPIDDAAFIGSIIFQVLFLLSVFTFSLVAHIAVLAPHHFKKQLGDLSESVFYHTVIIATNIATDGISTQVPLVFQAAKMSLNQTQATMSNIIKTTQTFYYKLRLLDLIQALDELERAWAEVEPPAGKKAEALWEQLIDTKDEIAKIKSKLPAKTNA